MIVVERRLDHVAADSSENFTSAKFEADGIIVENIYLAVGSVSCNNSNADYLRRPGTISPPCTILT